MNDVGEWEYEGEWRSEQRGRYSGVEVAEIAEAALGAFPVEVPLASAARSVARLLQLARVLARAVLPDHRHASASRLPVRRGCTRTHTQQTNVTRTQTDQRYHYGTSTALRRRRRRS